MSLPSKVVDVIVLGAGAAGLMCAQTAGHRGKSVLVLDHANKAGKKILMSGGGRCNFTNLYTEASHFISHNPHFCKSALARFTQWDFLALIDKHQVAHHEKKLGQLFCDGKASAILNLLLDECTAADVTLQLDTRILKIHATEHGFSLDTEHKTLGAAQYHCRSLVIATGGLSIPTLGASGFGYQVAEQFGHHLLPRRAGLVPFTITDGQLKQLCVELSGTSVSDCQVSCNGQSFTEDLLFTHRGLSGPVMLQISSFWQMGDALEINWLPDRDATLWLTEQQHSRPNLELKTLLAERFTKKMAQLICEQFLINLPLKQLSPKQLQQIASWLNGWQVTPAGTEGYRTAEVTLGGVDTREVSSKTMASLKQANLYFIGEVLDVTGQLGGFNFQWAWASGHAAGTAV